MTMNLALLFKLIFLVEDLVLLAWGYHCWRHQHDYYNECRESDSWRTYFKEHVAHNWTFFDGLGY